MITVQTIRKYFKNFPELNGYRFDDDEIQTYLDIAKEISRVFEEEGKVCSNMEKSECLFVLSIASRVISMYGKLQDERYKRLYRDLEEKAESLWSED